MTIPTGNIRAARAVATALVALGITACQPSREPAANEAAETPANVEAESNMAVSGNAVAAEEPEEAKKSIIRPDVEPSPTPTPPAEPVELTVPFPAKGAQPDPAGIALLDTLAADPVLALGGPITIWGHSDSSGSDASNLIASRKRAEAAALLERLGARGLTLATAESCTGGLIAATLTAIAGSSAVVTHGFVTYSNEAKRDVLGVPWGVLEGYGAVSESVARRMAEGALARSGAALAVSCTGIAGPGGATPGKPVGLVHIHDLLRIGLV